MTRWKRSDNGELNVSVRVVQRPPSLLTSELLKPQPGRGAASRATPPARQKRQLEPTT
jgi:hypothetical protein